MRGEGRGLGDGGGGCIHIWTLYIRVVGVSLWGRWVRRRGGGGGDGWVWNKPGTCCVFGEDGRRRERGIGI